jgi:GNAT superfamily N-acetyltransferase
MTIIELTSDDTLLVENYGRHWQAMGIEAIDVRGDWRSEAQDFLEQAREQSGLAAFVAKVEGQPVGTACCHLVQRAFPAFRKADADLVGYVWGVFVRPEQRGRGIGGMLVSACMSHLRMSGCGRALLHAGDRSAALYRRMGFIPTDEFAAVL